MNIRKVTGDVSLQHHRQREVTKTQADSTGNLLEFDHPGHRIRSNINVWASSCRFGRQLIMRESRVGSTVTTQWSSKRECATSLWVDDCSWPLDSSFSFRPIDVEKEDSNRNWGMSMARHLNVDHRLHSVGARLLPGPAIHSWCVCCVFSDIAMTGIHSWNCFQTTTWALQRHKPPPNKAY